MSSENIYTLSDAVELFFMGDSKQKNFKSAMVVAKFVWNEILRRTIWAFESQWMPVHQGNPYHYIMTPEGSEMVLAIKEEVECNGQKSLRKLVEVKNMVVSTPSVKACGCKLNCGCGDACAHINSYVHTTVDHIIRGETYEEKIWTEVCKNGDILQWREVPTEKYVGAAFDSVVFEKQKTVICKVVVKECGCLEETATNRELVEKYCGACAPACVTPVVGACETVFQYGECGLVYLIGAKVNTQYQVVYQRSVCESSKVPEYALECLHLGMDYKLKMLNPTVPRHEKEAAKYAYRDGKNEVIKYLNPIDLQFVEDLYSHS